MDITDEHKKDLEGSKAGRLVKKLKTVEGHNAKFPGLFSCLTYPRLRMEEGHEPGMLRDTSKMP